MTSRVLVLVARVSPLLRPVVVALGCSGAGSVVFEVAHIGTWGRG